MVEEKLIFTLSLLRPFLVVIKITPFAAAVPHKPAAAALFNTSTDAISFGLISLKRDCSDTPWVDPPRLLLNTGLPSIITKGWVLPVMVLCPRIWI